MGYKEQLLLRDLSSGESIMRETEDKLEGGVGGGEASKVFQLLFGDMQQTNKAAIKRRWLDHIDIGGSG